MITLFTGTPGSGKSYQAARRIVQRLRQGKTVIANFDINTDVIKRCKGKFIYLPDEMITVKWLINYAMDNHIQARENQTLLIIDEAQIKFNCRGFGAADRNEWIRFFSLHRHLGYSIIMITQMDRMLDKQIRGLVEYEIRHKKLNRNGFVGIILCFTMKTWFMAIEYWYGSKMVLSRSMFTYKKKYGKIYDSYKLFSTFAAGGDGGNRVSGGAPREPAAQVEEKPLPLCSTGVEKVNSDEQDKEISHNLSNDIFDKIKRELGGKLQQKTV